MSDSEHTEAERLESAELTLHTIREHAKRGADPAAWLVSDHARGYQRAMRDVLAILDARWEPPNVPVVLGEQP